jgi:hypothetical protein
MFVNFKNNPIFATAISERLTVFWGDTQAANEDGL